MFRSLKRAFRNWLTSEDIKLGKECPTNRRSPKNLSFNISNANGGYVMDFSYYDQKTDRHHNELYVIHDNENLAESISHIITLECLKHRG